MNGRRKPTRRSKVGSRPKGFEKAYSVTAKGRRYWYAWRGGPRVPDPNADPVAFARAYAEAHAGRVQPREPETLADLVEAYRRSPEFLSNLAPSTRAIRALRLAAIARARIGKLPILALEARKATGLIVQWRNTMASTPRAADEHVETLSVVLNYAILMGHLIRNPAARVPALYQRGARKTARWRASDLDAAKPHLSAQARLALAAACLTGLRRGDLCALQWPEVDFTRALIRRPTNKSGRRSVAYIPLTGPALELLASIPEREGYVFRRDDGRPWEVHALTKAVTAAAQAAGLDLKLHDARGTYATTLYAAGLAYDEIEQRMGWEAGQAKARRLDYVDEEEVAAALARRLSGFASEGA